MKIIKEGKAPTIVFTCNVCQTIFEEESKKCGLIKDPQNSYWWIRCPICGQTVEQYIHEAD